jgi:hypothetical protein
MEDYEAENNFKRKRTEPRKRGFSEAVVNKTGHGTKSVPLLPAKGFKITVEGTFGSLSGSGKIVKPYKIDVFLPKMDSALSVISNKLLKPILKAKHNSFQFVVTHIITNVIDLEHPNDPMIEIQYMNRSQLVDYSDKRGINIESYLYPDILDFRDAVTFAENNREEYELKQEKLAIKINDDNEIMRMNAELMKMPEPEE